MRAHYDHIEDFSPDRAFMIGDAVRDDVQGALNAGFMAAVCRAPKSCV